MTKASDNEFPSLLFKEDTAPASPASGDQRLFIDSADHIVKVKNSGGTVTPVGGGGGTITTKDEGSTLSTAVTTLDFVGAGVTASGAGATTTVTIPGGGGTDVVQVASGAGSVTVSDLKGSPDADVAGANDDEFKATWVNSGSAGNGWTLCGAPTTMDSNTTVKSGLYIRRSTHSGDSLDGIYKACPSIPFTMTAKLLATQWLNDYNGAGIYVAEASPGKLSLIGLLSNSSVLVLSQMLYTSPTAFGSSPTSRTIDILHPWWPPLYLRIVVHSSSSIDYQVSLDGFIWRTLSAGADPGFTVGSVGLYVNSNASGSAGIAYFGWVRFT